MQRAIRPLTAWQKRMARFIIRYPGIDFFRLIFRIWIFMVGITFALSLSLVQHLPAYISNIWVVTIIATTPYACTLLSLPFIMPWLDKALTGPEHRSNWENSLVEIQSERARDYILGDPEERSWILFKVREAQEKDDATELKMILDTLIHE